MSLLFSFKKSGAMIAPRRMTFATQGTPADIRNTYLKAISASLSGCEPFKLRPASATPSPDVRS